MGFLKNFWGPGAGQINGESLRRMARNALLAAAGAGLTVFSEWFSAVDFGALEGPIMLAFAGGLDAIRRFLTNYAK